MKIVCQPPPESPATATRCGIGVVEAQEHVQAALHGQIEGGQAAGAAQVELVHAAVLEAGRGELAHAEPFDVQRQHAALGLVDAANLLVGDGLCPAGPRGR